MSAPPPEVQLPIASGRRWETWAMVSILMVSLLVQGNAILHHGYMGQDYGHHTYGIRQAIQAPNSWVYLGSNPPLLYWLGAIIHHVTLLDCQDALLSLVLVLLNLIALYVWFKLSQSMIRSPLLRFGTLLTLTFLPVRLIHAEVIASDGLIVLPFSLLVLLFVRLLRSRDPRRQLALAVLISAALGFGFLSKYTMFSAVPVALLILVIFRRNFEDRLIWWVTLGLIVAVAAAVAWPAYLRYREIPANDSYRQSWRREMDWRSLLFFKAADIHVLDAPGYDERIQVNGQEVQNLLINNKHSQPALLHLSTYTDVMNIFQYDASDAYFGPRSDVNQRRMSLAVKSAVLLSALTVVAVVACLLRIVYFLFRRRARLTSRPVLEQTVILGFSLAFYANIVLCLPYIANPYYWGYWLARLVLPSLMGFVFIGFVFLDEYVRSWRMHLVVVGYAVAQAMLHLSFLWPRGP